MRNVCFIVGAFSVIIASSLWSASAHACSVFSVSSDGHMLVGNNEDLNKLDAFMHFVPGTATTRGYVLFTYEDNLPQGGMNSSGLFFDITAQRPRAALFDPSLPYRGYDLVVLEVLQQASSVEEAVQIISRYNIPEITVGQIMFADKSGQSAVVSQNDEGKREIIYKTGNFQLMTNFRLASQIERQEGCVRFQIATDFLKKGRPNNVKNAVEILSSIHFEGLAPTVYSNVYDLKQQKMYLYYFHNYATGKMFSLKDELQKGPRRIQISSLFSRNYAVELTKSLMDFTATHCQM